MPRPREVLLTRERIVAVATDLLDTDGLAALSTRALARRLGVRAPSLYNHFTTKDEILEAVADAIVAQVDLSGFGRLPWPVALAGWAREHRAAIAAHPNAIPLLATGPALRPAALRLADVLYGTLVQAGWPPGHATRIGAAMRYLVIGSALGSFAGGFVPDPAVYTEEYPHLREAYRLAEHRDRVDTGAFELALAAMIDGLVALFPSVAVTTAAGLGEPAGVGAAATGAAPGRRSRVAPLTVGADAKESNRSS